MIEASSQNIAVGTPFDEIVAKVHVVEGDHVQAGDIRILSKLQAN